MIPTFVPIVSGLAEQRSPPLIATHRYPGSGANRLIAGPISRPDAATLMRPWDATRSARPSGSGAAWRAATIALRSASRSSRATSGPVPSGEDGRHGLSRVMGLGTTCHDADVVPDGGTQAEQRRDTACVGPPAVRFDRDLRLERA